MNSNDFLSDPDRVFSPGLLFFADKIEHNIAEAIRIAGGPDRLRPHVKTHKCPQIVKRMLSAGIKRHKSATIAEAEMLAQAGAPDILLAHPAVGPNVRRLLALAERYPHTRFAALVDDLQTARTLGCASTAANRTTDVFLDLDVGQHRTGIAPGEAAARLYLELAQTPGLRPMGLSVYDGHNTASDPMDRQRTADALMEEVLKLRNRIEAAGVPVPTLVVGGTPQFPVHAARDIPGLELSPGTFVLQDTNYGPQRYRDLATFEPAALLMTRVISRPGENLITFDLGHKAVSADPGPVGGRLTLLGVADAILVSQSEEHLVVSTPFASQFRPGDVAYAIPTHICPTVALYDYAEVVRDRKIVDRWSITARRRVIQI
jgi:D-serine deaminase-like pyridoxal phosphate-dependent protein